MIRALLILLASAAGCVPARQVPPGSAPTAILEGSTLDTGGAQPDDRGVPQPAWPGPRILLASEPPVEPVRVRPVDPPRATRELCSPWWRRWLVERALEHGVVEPDGWWDVQRPPPAGGDGWWAIWLGQELGRCEADSAPAEGWLGY